MKTYLKYLLLGGSLLPLIWFSVYKLGVFGEIFWPLHVLALIIFSAPVIIWYAVEVICNASLTDHDKVVWIILLLLFGNIVQLIYWFRWVRTS